MNVKKYSSYEQIKDKAFPFYIARNKIAGFAKHTHEHFEFFYVVSGTSKHILEKKEETLRAGNIILMTPEVAHAFENSSPDFMICNCIFLPSLLETHKNLLAVIKEYFCDIFKRITGKTFTEYVNSLRVEHAVRLLLSTSMKASEIALESGFNDISYFNRVFKEQKGISPQALRKKA